MSNFSFRQFLEFAMKRIEVILICAEDEREGMLMATREIIRSDTDVHLGALRILQANGMEDRMIGLLPRKGTVQ